MASIPQNHPALSLHLTDALLTPLLSSSSTTSSYKSNPESAAQQNLQTASLTTYTTARRLGLGRPLRVLIETSDKGPVVLHSYINPPATHIRNDQPNGKEGDLNIVEESGGLEGILSSTRGGLHDVNLHEEPSSHGELVNGSDAEIPESNSEPESSQERDEEADEEEDFEESEDEQLSKLLIATVVAPNTNHIRDAKRAVGRLERLGTEFQRELIREAEERRNAEEVGEVESS